jgi:hypothetical protein
MLGESSFVIDTIGRYEFGVRVGPALRPSDPSLALHPLNALTSAALEAGQRRIPDGERAPAYHRDEGKKRVGRREASGARGAGAGAKGGSFARTQAAPLLARAIK